MAILVLTANVLTVGAQVPPAPVDPAPVGEFVPDGEDFLQPENEGPLPEVEAPPATEDTPYTPPAEDGDIAAPPTGEEEDLPGAPGEEQEPNAPEEEGPAEVAQPNAPALPAAQEGGVPETTIPQNHPDNEVEMQTVQHEIVVDNAELEAAFLRLDPFAEDEDIGREGSAYFDGAMERAVAEILVGGPRLYTEEEIRAAVQDAVFVKSVQFADGCRALLGVHPESEVMMGLVFCPSDGCVHNFSLRVEDADHDEVGIVLDQFEPLELSQTAVEEPRAPADDTSPQEETEAPDALDEDDGTGENSASPPPAHTGEDGEKPAVPKEEDLAGAPLTGGEETPPSAKQVAQRELPAESGPPALAPGKTPGQSSVEMSLLGGVGTFAIRAYSGWATGGQVTISFWKAFIYTNNEQNPEFFKPHVELYRVGAGGEREVVYGYRTPGVTGELEGINGWYANRTDAYVYSNKLSNTGNTLKLQKGYTYILREVNIPRKEEQGNKRMWTLAWIQHTSSSGQPSFNHSNPTAFYNGRTSFGTFDYTTGDYVFTLDDSAKANNNAITLVNALGDGRNSPPGPFRDAISGTKTLEGAPEGTKLDGFVLELTRSDITNSQITATSNEAGQFQYTIPNAFLTNYLNRQYISPGTFTVRETNTQGSNTGQEAPQLSLLSLRITVTDTAGQTVQYPNEANPANADGSVTFPVERETRGVHIAVVNEAEEEEPPQCSFTLAKRVAGAGPNVGFVFKIEYRANAAAPVTNTFYTVLRTGNMETTFQNLPPGVYTVTEQQGLTAGYTQSGVSPQGGTVTLTGEEEQPPQIVFANEYGNEDGYMHASDAQENEYE